MSLRASSGEDGSTSLRKILVGYDGSEPAARALDLAISLVVPNDGVEIHIACVVQKPSGTPDPVPDEVLESLQTAAREELLDAERRVKRSFSTPIVHMEVGNPGERLLELAARIKPDLVVLGTLKHPASERVLGTVSSFFLKSRRYPLLIVP